jgi:hypothetical protein
MNNHFEIDAGVGEDLREITANKYGIKVCRQINKRTFGKSTNGYNATLGIEKLIARNCLQRKRIIPFRYYFLQFIDGLSKKSQQNNRL